MRLRLSMWTYPWDVQDLGVEAVARELGERGGLNTISLAASYHAGHFLQPRSPKRKAYFPEDGTIYFQPTPALWERLRLQPRLAGIVREGGDVLRDLVRQRDEGGLGVSCWTVCLHNTRLGMLHPEAVTRNAFGDPNLYSLCPSNPDARAYVCALVEDLTRGYRPDAVELESPSFMGFLHGYHHEKDGVGLTPEDDFLLSLCFCPCCLERARAAGVNGEAARETARRWIVAACERATPEPWWPDFPARGIAAFQDHPEVHNFLRWRFEPVTSLVAAIRDRADPATRIHVIDLKDGWREGCDAAALARVCDGTILCAYDMDPGATVALIRGGRAAVGSDRFLAAGLRLFYPEISGPEALTARTLAAAEAGASGINFYNWGLVPAPRLDWVRQAVDAVARRGQA